MNRQSAPKIGLLTPYTGRNLGDGAIQEAVIANIRARYPNALIHGFTISPETTEILHGVPCSALTSLHVPNYSGSVAINTSTVGQDKPVSTGILVPVKSIIKKNAFLFRTLKSAQRMPKKASNLVAEVRLVKRGYSLLKECDLLIVSGGGQIDDYWGGAWGHPFSLLKWGLAARLVGTRYIFLSVGTCTLEERLSAMFVKWALRLASYRSYRDQTSKELLHHLRFTHNDAVFPDLAFSHDIPAKKKVVAKPNQSLIVGISPIAYLSSYYWPEENVGTYASYVKKLLLFIVSLLKEDISVVLFHTSGTDKYVVKELVEALCNDKSSIRAESIRVANTETVGDLLSVIEELDCLIASRLHGVLLAHLMNKPVLAISYDRKVTTHMEELEQLDYCVDIHDFSSESLTNKFDALISDKNNIKTILNKKVAEYKKSLDTQYDEVLSKIY